MVIMVKNELRHQLRFSLLLALQSAPSVSYGQKPRDTEASSNHPLMILSKVRERARNGFEGHSPRTGPGRHLMCLDISSG